MIRLLLPAVGFAVLSACSLAERGMDFDAVALPDGTGECEDRVAQGDGQAILDLCVLSHDVMEGRLVGTPGNALARAYIIDRFQQIGLEPLSDSFEHPFSFQRRIDFRDPDSPRETLDAVNLIARFPARTASKVMAVTAHYDHIGPGENNEIYNGADDNASGVAGLLAAAEHLMREPAGSRYPHHRL